MSRLADRRLHGEVGAPEPKRAAGPAFTAPETSGSSRGRGADPVVDGRPSGVGVPRVGGARAGIGRRGRILRGIGVALVLVVVASVAYVGATFVQVWRASGRDEAREADAIVVLGAAQYDGRPSPVLRNRLDHALELYERRIAPLVVVTGGRQEGDRFTEATTGYNYLRSKGVPDDAIRKEVQGRTTYESLAAVARFLREEGIRDVVLVSGPAHAERLGGIARDVGLRAVVSPSGGDPSLQSLLRETIAVSAGRVVGYRRLERFDG